MIDQFPLADTKMETPTRGNYVLIRPVSNFAVAALDLSTKKFGFGSKQYALDISNDVFVIETKGGEVAMYNVANNSLISRASLPRSTFGRLRATALSPDFRWLAISERTRGAMWDVSSGERLLHVRGFRGAYLEDEGLLYADFPQGGGKERSMAIMDRAGGAAAKPIPDRTARQYGPVVISTKPSKPNGSYSKDVIMDVRDTKSLDSLWTKPFPREAPRYWVNNREGTMVLLWSTSTDAARTEIKNDPKLGQQLAAMKEREGNYFIQALDSRTGKTLGQLIVETGKGSFRINSVFAVDDWLIVSDSDNRVLVYQLSTGQPKGKVFGQWVTASA